MAPYRFESTLYERRIHEGFHIEVEHIDTIPCDLAEELNDLSPVSTIRFVKGLNTQCESLRSSDEVSNEKLLEWLLLRATLG